MTTSVGLCWARLFLYAVRLSCCARTIKLTLLMVYVRCLRKSHIIVKWVKSSQAGLQQSHSIDQQLTYISVSQKSLDPKS